MAWPLSERGCTVYLAHPKKSHDLRKFYALHTKTDVTDAEALARMPLVDTHLQQLWRPSMAVQSLQRLCRLRWKSRCRIADLKKRLSQLDDRISELYGEVDPQQSLLQVPGLGEFLAAGITAIIGDVRRFPSAKHLVNYSGLAPRVKSSGGKAKARQGITKHGNPYLRAWAFLAAENSRQYDPELKAYYQAMRKRGKHHLTAVCATASRLLERVYGILSEQAGQTEKESQAHSVGTG